MQQSTKIHGHCGANQPIEICELLGNFYPFTGK